MKFKFTRLIALMTVLFLITGCSPEIPEYATCSEFDFDDPHYKVVFRYVDAYGVPVKHEFTNPSPIHSLELPRDTDIRVLAFGFDENVQSEISIATIYVPILEGNPVSSTTYEHKEIYDEVWGVDYCGIRIDGTLDSPPSHINTGVLNVYFSGGTIGDNDFQIYLRYPAL